MLDLLRNPRAAAGVQSFFAAKKSAAESPLLSEKKVEQAVQRLKTESSRFGVTATLIRSQGSHAEPALLRALSDPGFLAAEAASDHFLDVSPAAAAIDLLGQVGTPRCLPVLFRLRESPDRARSRAALFAVLKIAGPEHFSEIARIVGAMGLSERRSILTAVQNRFYGRVPTEQERDFFWSLVLNGDGRPKEFNRDMVMTLGAVDAERLATMISEDLRSADDRIMLEAAQSVDSFDGLVDVPELRSLMERVEEPRLRANILKASARQAHHREVWESMWRSEAARDAEGDSLSESIRASTLLDAIAANLGHASIYDAVGYTEPNDEIAQPLLDIKLVMMAQSEISNGGFLQFFFNSRGATWRSVVASINRNKLGQSGDIIRRAAGVIGLVEGDADRSAIERRLASLSQKQEQQLEELTKEFYRISDRLTLAIANHLADHRDWFEPRIAGGAGRTSRQERA